MTEQPKVLDSQEFTVASNYIVSEVNNARQTIINLALAGLEKDRNIAKLQEQIKILNEELVKLREEKEEEPETVVLPQNHV